MKKILALAVAVIFALSASAYTERNLIASRVTKDGLKEILLPGQKWVNLPAYTDRAGWDALFGDEKEFYIKRGEAALKHDWPRVKATDYLEYERSGNRVIMENPHNANINAVADLLLAELAEGKGRFIDQLINGVYAAAEMTSWALSAHIPVIAGRSIQPYDQQVIDLWTAAMGSLYSWVYYFMKPEFDKINPEISRRLRHELETRVLEPYMDYDRWWWDGGRYYNGRMLNNWTPSCLSGVLMTAMLMEDNQDLYADIAYNTILGMDKFLNYVPGDGACEEGPGYWNGFAGKVLDYMDMLSLATGGKLDISDEKLVKDMGEFIARSYVGDGWVVNFADAGARGGGDPYLLYRYGKAVDSDLLKSYAAMRRESKPSTFNGMDVMRTFDALSIAPELREYKGDFMRPDYTWYPETEFCYISTPQNLFFATKGGYNDESHNHNDIGTFSVWADNYPLIIDAGVGIYTRQTFSDERYNIWTMQSGWHNLPVVNGYEQPHGKQFKATDIKTGKNSIELNIGSAYPEEAGINDWIRAYNVKGREVKVTDRFDLKEAKTPNVVNFLSWGDIDVSKPGEVNINVNGHKATLTYNPSQFDVKVTDQELTDKKLTNVWGQKVSRISLTDKKPAKKGSYTYKIKAL